MSTLDVPTAATGGTATISRRSPRSHASTASGGGGMLFDAIDLNPDPHTPLLAASKRLAARDAQAKVRVMELELDNALPPPSTSVGMRRIQSSPSITQPSSTASRKKNANSATAATKAARRLARKAEAARVSRRKKKAYLEEIEKELHDLEEKYALLTRQANGSATITGADMSINVGTPSSRTPQVYSSSNPVTPLGHHDPHNGNMKATQLSFPEVQSLTYQTSAPPAPLVTSSTTPPIPLPTPVSSLPERFHSILQSLGHTRQEHSLQRADSLQSVTRPTPSVEFMSWLLASRGGLSNDTSLNSATNIDGVVGMEMSPPFAGSLLATPPMSNSMLSPPLQSPQPMWPSILTNDFGLPAELIHRLFSSSSSTSTSLALTGEAIRSSFHQLDDSLVELRRDLDAYFIHRRELNEEIWKIFHRPQMELLASTAFKQQRQMQLQQQQQQQQQRQQQQNPVQPHLPSRPSLSRPSSSPSMSMPTHIQAAS